MKRKTAQFTLKGRRSISILNRMIGNIFGRINKKAIFIVGNQKTGSTAIACLLAKATQSSFAHDFLYFLKPSGQKMLFEQGIPFRKIVSRNKYFFSKQIIKELDLIFCIDQVFEVFPEGRFVFILRDPRDNIRSILNRLHLPGNQQQLSPEQWKNLPHPAWRDNLEGSLYGIHGNSYIETLANRWCYIIDQFERFRSRLHLLRYEDFIQDKVSCIEQLAEQVGLIPQTRINEYVDVQYQPRGDRTVSWEDFFGKQNLLLIEQTCLHKMNSYQYKPILLS